jgi:hypothetical protein
MAIDRVRTLDLRRKGFNGDFCGGIGGAGGLEDTLGVRSGGGGGDSNGRLVIRRGVSLPSISSYSRSIMRSNIVRTHEAQIIICGMNPM